MPSPSNEASCCSGSWQAAGVWAVRGAGHWHAAVWGLQGRAVLQPRLPESTVEGAQATLQGAAEAEGGWQS
jgi:uncharacterized membrane protein YhiD involved in acid resistance